MCEGVWCICVCVWFFFSSRRRHTRLQGDWSSDVCSSDLEHPRAYEVVFNGAKHTADIVDKLADLHKKMNDLEKEDPKPVAGATNVQNNMFVGSTSELMKMLKENK